MPTPLLTSKLVVPTPRPDLVTRARLIERLTQGLDRKLTLVSAPAGFGKSMLLAEWAAGVSRPVAWLSLDGSDNDLARFVRYLVAALQTMDTSIGQEVQALSPPLQAAALEEPLTLLLNELGEAGPLLLVLDDYHFITAEAIHGILMFLIEHLPSGIHLAIATRADPPLPLARLRGRGELRELRAPDLQFTIEETQAFFSDTMHLQLHPENSAALQTRTEGWIAGLQLAGLSLQGREDATEFVAAFAGSHRYILDYLIDEVLSRQPEDVQSFLLHTCILNRLTGPLCDAVANGGGGADGQGMLADLDSANLFTIPLDDERRWYRYHHLFADSLQAQLRRNDPDLVPELHRRAADWYASNGFLPEAVEHVLQTDDPEYAAVLIERTALDLQARTEFSTVRRWLDALPADVVEHHPSLCIFYGWTLIDSGEMENAKRWVDRASDAELPRHLRYLRAGLRAMLGRARGEPWQPNQFTAELAVDAGSMLETDILDEQLRAYLAVLTTFELAEALKMRGRLRQAIQTYRDTLHRVERIEPDARLLSIRGLAELGLGALLYEQNDLAATERHVTDGIELARRGLNERTVAVGYLVLAMVRRAQDRSAEGIQLLDRAQKWGFPEMILHVKAQRTRIARLQGDRGSLANWAEGYQASVGPGAPKHKPAEILPGFADLTHVRALLGLGRIDEAMPLIENLLEHAQATDQTRHTLELLVLKAEGMQARGETSQALDAFEQALVIGEPEGFVRTFVDEGASISNLLLAGREQLSRVGGTYIETLLEALGLHVGDTASPGAGVPIAVGQSLVEPLTARELEVLQLLEAGLHNSEIAERLVVSLGTVKRHTGNIYSKLGVESRTQALARARHLGLL
jgi:LuxR family maltose regulon positive regulatory protein